MTQIDLSVITATWKRPKLLAMCLEQFRRQKKGNLRCEHIVVSDGPDEKNRAVAKFFGARYVERAATGGAWGAFAKDTGIEIARGRYVVFWDDDNSYLDHSLLTLYEAASGVDIGVARTTHFDGMVSVVIPRKWDGSFRLGDIDTMCVCVRREVAVTEKWGLPNSIKGTDHHWLRRLQKNGASIRFINTIIGSHLDV